MSETLAVPLLSSLSDFLSNEMGLHFPSNRLGDLERGIRAAARDFNFVDAEHCAEWLLSSPPLTRRQIETLACHLTVGETYFFRERATYDALETQVLPELIRSRAAERRLRIWSAGCATGEEPYSIAILLTRLIPDWTHSHISILGTDLNTRSLQTAAAGEYSAWSFRGCSPALIDRYFRKIDERRWQISADLNARVVFAYLNLVEDTYPSLLNATNALDIIFCRNVLMYFSAEQARRVVARLHRCLVEGGWLVVSATEAAPALTSLFRAVSFPGAILYRKDGNSKLEIRNSHTGLPPALWPVQNSQSQDQNVPYSQCVSGSGAGDLSAYPPVFIPETFSRGGENVAGGGGNDPGEESTNVKQLLPLDAEALATEARMLADQGHLAEALSCCDKAIGLDRVRPSLHFLRATILQEQDAADEAVNSLRRAIFLDPRFILGHFALGTLQRARGRRQEARKCLENALALLNDYGQEDILPESEGVTAGRLREIIEKTLVY